MENLKKYIELMKNYAIRFLEWSKTNWKEGTTGKLKAVGAWFLIIFILRLLFGGNNPVTTGQVSSDQLPSTSNGHVVKGADAEWLKRMGTRNCKRINGEMTCWGEN